MEVPNDGHVHIADAITTHAPSDAFTRVVSKQSLPPVERQRTKEKLPDDFDDADERDVRKKQVCIDHMSSGDPATLTTP